MRAFRYFIASLLLPALTACMQLATVKSPTGYDLSKPAIFEMPAALKEISGIAFNKGNPAIVYAEQDEDGKVFILKPGNMHPDIIDFGQKGDYEDISIYHDTVIVLRSDGQLSFFALNEVSDHKARNVTTISNAVPKGEYEAMFADETEGYIYILCKDSHKGQANGYKIQLLPTGKAASTHFSIDERYIRDLTGKKKAGLRASAMARNKRTNEWYILSAINKMLVVTDQYWKPKNIYPLGPSSLYPQPEGIAFDEYNNLYIANEAAGTGAGTILQFAYKNKN